MVQENRDHTQTDIVVLISHKGSKQTSQRDMAYRIEGIASKGEI